MFYTVTELNKEEKYLTYLQPAVRLDCVRTWPANMRKLQFLKDNNFLPRHQFFEGQ